MTHQSESQLENILIEQLKGLEYNFIKIKDEQDLLKNLKEQLENHNFKTLKWKRFSEKEFEKILNHLSKWTVFEKAKTLRDKMSLELDSGEKIWIEFLDVNNWCQNDFQVTNQISMEWIYKNRYDVTILINWIPLVQIELKRRWLELKEAFNQINRYHKHSFWSWVSLFQYIQIFIISNWVNTKYFANNKNQSFKQTFFWSDKENKNITNLEEFTNIFLEPCHISKMITRYIVLNESDKILMILRPYQYFAVEAIIDRVKNSSKNWYIWHTTGSWKTLTSFKAAQILTKIPEVKKVVFVVDRKDLDTQTIREFNSFSKWSVDGTDDTKQLVKQFENNDTKLIITTIQKLNTAISKEKYLKKMDNIKDEKIVFIFDECHRSQFWETHNKIKKYFSNNQMFWFTWTPILEENNNNNKTTKDLFDKQLHTYVITDAIKDENVLKFSVEYIWKYKTNSNTNLDIEVEDIDKKELLESEKRLEKIVDYIIKNHDTKTHNWNFTAMFCVSSVDVLIKYYEIFKRKNSKLKIATIFSYSANEDDKNANWLLDDDTNFEIKENEENKHSREKLDEFINDYNKLFWTNFSTKDSKSFYWYYKDIADKVKKRQIDILLVVNMFLTGFDSKTLNTLYVDKNLKYHWLIQAFSRTNRILNEQKSQWNIVCFRNLKKDVDDAIKLFSDKNANETVLMESFENYVKYFNEAFEKLKNFVPKISDIDNLNSEEEKFEFVKLFRDLARIKNILQSFSDFSFEKINIEEQEFEDYKSKYLDIYDSVKNQTEKQKVSILDDVDFELELITVDIINIDYILNILWNILDSNNTNFKENTKKQVLKMINSEPKLLSKRYLIEKFIEENLSKIDDSSKIKEIYEKFFDEEKTKAFEQICKEENLDKEKFEKIVWEYLYSWKEPKDDLIIWILNYKPNFFERLPTIERILNKVKKFLNIFET